MSVNPGQDGPAVTPCSQRPPVWEEWAVGGWLLLVLAVAVVLDGDWLWQRWAGLAAVVQPLREALLRWLS